MWLYEDLLNEKPKVWLRAKRNRELRKERSGQSVEVPEEDRLLTPEEIKKKRLKRQLKEWKDRWLIKEKQWQKERNEKYWLDIWRTYVYLKEEFWAAIAETYHELEEESRIIPGFTESEQDEKDREYLLNHKYDWFYDGSRFWMSRYNWYLSRSFARWRWTIWSPIKLIATASLQKIYNNYITAQEWTRSHLQELAKDRGMSVQAFVEWWFREEDIVRGRRGFWRSKRPTYKPKEWSWLEEVMKDAPFKFRIVALDYIRMIRDWTFTLNEACVPFNTYVVGDYVLFGNKACAVPSMFGNGEFFNEENREMIHHRWRYALRFSLRYDIASKIPIFNGTDMKIVKISNVKISDKDEWHNNWSYAYYLVPQTRELGKKWNKELTMEEVIAKFHTPSTENMWLTKANPKTDLTDMQFPRREKRHIFYFDTSS